MNDLPVKIKKYEDFYTKTRKKIKKWIESGKISKWTKGWAGNFVEYLILLPDIIHLLIKLLTDKEVSSKYKTMILIVMGYLLSPIDIIPDFIPVAGLVDDLLVAIIVLNRIINSDDHQMINKINAYWAGEGDILKQVKSIIDIANNIASELPKGLLNFMKGGKGKGRGFGKGTKK